MRPHGPLVWIHGASVGEVLAAAALIERLRKAYPSTIVGIKDSAGDFNNMQKLVEQFPGFSVLAGADPLMLPLLKAGGAGCITATSNLVAGSLRTIYDKVGDHRETDTVEAAQARINAYRTLSNSYVQIPTIKAMVELKTKEAGWRRTRAPLMPLTDVDFASLSKSFNDLP